MRSRSVPLALALLLLLSSGAVAAQSVPTGGNSTGTGSTSATATPAESSSTTERIDNSTLLVNSSYDPETGMVSVTLSSETLQEVTLSDAGAVVGGGEINQRSATLAPGETATLTLDVTESEDGFVGVTVATDDVLYSVPVEPGGSGGSPIPDRDDALALVVGISLVPIATLGLHRYRKRKRSQAVVRVDG